MTTDKHSQFATRENEEKEPLKTKPEIFENENKKKGFFEPIKKIVSNITVEPVVAGFAIPGMVSMLAITNLNLEKACRVNLKYSDEVCTSLTLREGNYTNEEEETHKLLASVQIWKGAVSTVLPALLMLFIGAWSDKKGKRKILMLYPIGGEFIMYLLNMFSTYFFYEISIEWTVFLEVICASLTGGMLTLLVAAYSYLSDITTGSSRTFRLNLLCLSFSIGMSFGISLSGVLLKEIGYYGIFGLGAIVQCLNFMYVLFYIDDHTWLNTETKIQSQSCYKSFLEFFDLNSVKSTIGVVFNEGSNQRKLRCCILLFGNFVNSAIAWRSIIGVKYLLEKLKLDDSALGIISNINHILVCFIIALANKEYFIYAVPFIDVLSGAPVVALKAIATSLVTQNENGKMMALFALTDLVTPIIFSPIYNKVYMLVLDTPGLAMLTSAAILASTLILFSWFNVQHRRDRRQKIFNKPFSE